MLKAAPAIALVILVGPIAFGLLATLLPAFGYFPVLGGDKLTLAPFQELLAQPGLWQSSLISLVTGLVTSLVSLFIVLGFLAAWSGTQWFVRLQHVISPLLSVPHAAAAFGFAFMIAPSGWLLRIVSPELTGMTRPPDWLVINDPLGITMMAGLIIKEIPFLFLVSLSALPQVHPRRYTMVATSLGYGKMSGFLFCVWPRLYPQIRLAVFAVIAYASSVVDVALILGPTNPAPLAVRLIGWMNDPDLSMRFQASAGAVLQLLITLGCLIFWLALEWLGKNLLRVYQAKGHRFQRDRVLRQVSLLLVLFSVLLVFAGLGILTLWSFAGFWPFPDAVPNSFTLRTWERQLETISRPLGVTVAVGILATFIALAIVLACLERETRTGRSGGNRALLLLYLPLLVPQASFVFGLQLFFLMIGIDTQFIALVFIHIVFVLPYVFLSLADPWRAWDYNFARVAKSIGSGDNRIFWKIRSPMLIGSILVASAVGFAASIGQYLPTVLVGAGRWPTITTEAVALASGGDRRIIGVYAFLQMALPFIGFAIAALVPAFIFSNRRDMKASQ